MADPYSDEAQHARLHHVLSLHRPENVEVVRRMETLRDNLKTMGDLIIELVPPCPDRTRIINELWGLSMLIIGTIATNQDVIEGRPLDAAPDS